MRYLHHHKVIHRDLKPASILVDSNLYPCICDFGQSKYSLNINNSVDNQLFSSSAFGTPKYTAPEVFDNDVYDKNVDVYSYAIIAYEIVTEKEAFSREKNLSSIQFSNIILKGKRPEFPENTPYKIKELITNCWSQNPKKTSIL